MSGQFPHEETGVLSREYWNGVLNDKMFVLQDNEK